MVENQDSDGRCIRVLLVHDADREPEGMPRLLDEVTVPEIEVTRAADLAEAGQCLASGQQDIVLLQLDCVGTDADLAGAIGSINEAASDIAIILFGRPEQERAGAAALSSGAADFLVTDTLNSTALGRVLRYAVVRASLEARLRESERKYRKLFEHSGVAMVLVDGDSIRMVNQRAAELLSLPPEAQVEGMAFTSLLLQDEAARVMDLMKSADARTPLAFGTRVLRRCGDIRMMELNVVATSDSNTRIVSLLDLTDRLLAEAEIRRQREYFRALFGNSPEGIIAVDGLGRIEDANPSFERLFGFKRGELIGKMVLDTIVPARLSDSARQVLEASLSGGSCVAQTVRRRSDGSEVSVSILGAPFERNDARAGAFGIYRDVTAQLKAQERLEEAFIDLVETTARMMESVDPYTATHQRMVARLADTVGRKLGLDDNHLQGLYIGGLLHDVGKMSLPSTILTKPGRLTRQEWALIITHPRRGYDVLRDANLPWPVADMALRHHERLDGSGYPDGISGEQLGIEVRILAVCDVVEAMSSDRPYRTALPAETVLEGLAGGSGTKHDARVVEAVMHIITRGEFALGTGYVGHG